MVVLAVAAAVCLTAGAGAAAAQVPVAARGTFWQGVPVIRPAAAAGASHKARENPLPVAAIGGFTAGLLIGRVTKRKGRRKGRKR